MDKIFSALLTQHLEVLARIVQDVGVMIGVVLILGALYKFKQHGESRSSAGGQQSHATGAVVMMVVGAGLLSLPSLIQAGLWAIFTQNNPTSYQGPFPDTIDPIVVFVRVVGVGSFIRGLVLLSRTGGGQSQQGSMGKGFIHIFAGLLCIHVLGVYELMVQFFF